MCKFNDILIWECWGTKQAKEGKLGLRNTKTVWFNVKKDKYTPKRRYLENQISRHGHCICLVAEAKSMHPEVPKSHGMEREIWAYSYGSPKWLI